MNYNIAAYIIYLAFMVFIILYVGKRFYTNGRVFIISLFNGHQQLADHTNKLLLVAYYLFNIGYALVSLHFWEKVINLQMLISSISNNMAVLILILAVTHYFNMLVIHFLSASKSFSITNKSFQL